MSSTNELDAPGRSPGASPNDKQPRVLVLGVGNIMLGDEGFGVCLVRHLLERYSFPPGVEVVDGGTGGLALLPLIQSSDRVLLIDAFDAGAEAGNLFMCDSSEIEEDRGLRTSIHDTGILDVIQMSGLNGTRPETMVIGVQPQAMDVFGGELSQPVAARIERVTELVCEYLEKLGMAPLPKGRHHDAFLNEGRGERHA